MYSIDSEKESVSTKFGNFISKNISNLNFPIVDKQPNKIVLGPYKIITERNQFEVRVGNNIIESFSNRGWATAYAYFHYKGNINRARELKMLDKQAEKLLTEKIHYEYHIKSCHESNDEEKAYVYEDRLSRVDRELFSIKEAAKRLINF